mmetsp:Transcript_91181/g.292731  ORF Transcript_91181/g.292731 Transcript_91181/m.292731 type:complete len:433 (-) Transcript_91181:48-1346(-)
MHDLCVGGGPPRPGPAVDLSMPSNSSWVALSPGTARCASPPPASSLAVTRNWKPGLAFSPASASCSPALPAGSGRTGGFVVGTPCHHASAPSLWQRLWSSDSSPEASPVKPGAESVLPPATSAATVWGPTSTQAISASEGHSPRQPSAPVQRPRAAVAPGASDGAAPSWAMVSARGLCLASSAPSLAELRRERQHRSSGELAVLAGMDVVVRCSGSAAEALLQTPRPCRAAASADVKWDSGGGHSPTRSDVEAAVEAMSTPPPPPPALSLCSVSPLQQHPAAVTDRGWCQGRQQGVWSSKEPHADSEVRTPDARERRRFHGNGSGGAVVVTLDLSPLESDGGPSTGTPTSRERRRTNPLSLSLARDRFKLSVGATARSDEFRVALLRELDAIGNSPLATVDAPDGPAGVVVGRALAGEWAAVAAIAGGSRVG